MKEELYRKVYITSESDLPIEPKGYITNKGHIHFDPKGLKILNRIDYPEYWLNNIDWYLQTIVQPEQVKKMGRDLTNEELKEIYNNGESLTKPFLNKEKTAEKIDPREIMMNHCSDNGLLSMRLGKSILAAMEEYATQFKSQSVEQPSEKKTFTLTHVKNIFLAGYMSCQGKKSLKDARKWFINTYLKGSEQTTHPFRLTDDEIENERKKFCLWYYAQSQPLDANKVFKYFQDQTQTNLRDEENKFMMGL